MSQSDLNITPYQADAMRAPARPSTIHCSIRSDIQPGIRPAGPARAHHSFSARMLAGTALSVIAIATLSACGQRGPLYLPSEKQAQTKPLSADRSIEYDADGRPRRTTQNGAITGTSNAK
jgi:predicted small lipoprotein YifL